MLIETINECKQAGYARRRRPRPAPKDSRQAFDGYNHEPARETVSTASRTNSSAKPPLKISRVTLLSWVKVEGRSGRGGRSQCAVDANRARTIRAYDRPRVFCELYNTRWLTLNVTKTNTDLSMSLFFLLNYVISEGLGSRKER